MNSYKKLYINGLWKDVDHDKVIDVINPATEELTGQAPLATRSDVDQAVQAARNAFPVWSSTSSEVRAFYITAIADRLAARSEEMTKVITSEMGSPLDFCREVQVLGPINILSMHTEYTALRDSEEVIGNLKIIKEPIGVCALITPWNYPLHQLIGKIAPALAAGCTMVLKPSEITPLHAFLLAEIIDEVGLPAGVFNLVNGSGLDVGEPLISHPEIDLISFTGSTRAGVKISQLASTSIKRVCLELGGKSPFLISENADLETAVKMGVDDVMYNTGQTCTALTRMLIPAKHYNKAIEIAKEHAEKIKVGDPLNEDTFMGPMTSKSQLDVVLNYIKIGQEEGARLITGGQKTVGYDKGFYINPTIFADVKNDMTIAREEIFGPVLCMISYSDESEAIRIANDTPYGLSARVWCDDKQHGETLARQINAGQVYINDGLWNDAAPFGGYKQSGNGREFGSLGVEEFFETKSVLS